MSHIGQIGHTGHIGRSYWSYRSYKANGINNYLSHVTYMTYMTCLTIDYRLKHYFPLLSWNKIKFLVSVNAQRNSPSPQFETVFRINRFSNISVAFVKFK
jgi:hypothetical protein